MKRIDGKDYILELFSRYNGHTIQTQGWQKVERLSWKK